MEMITNEAFQDETVSVDGKAFSNCLFDEVTLVYTGGELPTFADCRFGDVKLQFESGAASTLRFMSGLPSNGFPAALENIVKSIRRVSG